LKPTIAFAPRDGEDTLLVDIDFNTQVKEDGSFISVLKMLAKDEDDDRLLFLPTPGDRFDVRLRAEGEFGGTHVWENVEPAAQGNTSDFGELEFGLANFLSEDAWLFTGRLLDSEGVPLRNVSGLVLLGFVADFPSLEGLKTDGEGWFVLTEVAYEDTEQSLATANWVIDVSNTAYIHDNLWSSHDAHIPLPIPEVDVERRVVAFWSIKRSFPWSRSCTGATGAPSVGPRAKVWSAAASRSPKPACTR
jgi:hypothetical protein